MTSLTIDDINREAQEAAHEDRRVRSLRESGALLIGGSLNLVAYEHTRNGQPPILTAEAMLSEGPLAFVTKTIEEVGGLDSARSKLAGLVRQGLNLDTYWHAYSYSDSGYSDAYTSCAMPGLHHACCADPGWVDLFADLGADLDICSSEGVTPIRMAVTLGETEALAALLRRGAKDAPDDRGYTLLHEAAERNDPASCEILLGAGASLVARDAKRGEVPLISAASADARAAFDCLVKHGASPLVLDDKGNTAAHAAMEEDFPEMAFHAIEAGVNPHVINVAGMTALRIGSKESQDRLKGLLQVKQTRDAAREALAEMGLSKGVAP